MKTIQAISIESQEVVRRLEQCSVGEIVAYDELSQICMGNIQTSKRHVLYTARHRLLVDRHIVFECVRNVGVKRVEDAEIVSTSGLTVKKINRLSKRQLQKLACVDFDKLDNAHKIHHNAVASIVGVISYATTAPKLKRIERAVEDSHQRLSLKETLDFFKGDK